MLPELFQRLKYKKKNVSCIVVAKIFIETQQILPNNVHKLEKNTFKDLWLPVIYENCN